MQPARYPIFERLGKVLHDQFEDVAREPLPDRWIDLINFLNDKERAQREGGRPAPLGPSKH